MSKEVGNLNRLTLSPGHQGPLGAKLGVAVCGTQAPVCSIRSQFPGADVVGKADAEDFGSDAFEQIGIFNGTQKFDSAAQITGHPVGTSDVDFWMASVFEGVNPTVFQISTYDAADSDGFTHAGNAGPETAPQRPPL